MKSFDLDEEELAQSRRLEAEIGAEIRANGGWIGFSCFMERALYAPSLGYYSGGLQKFGREGDFLTSPEISPLFGEALANQVAQVIRLSAPNLLEIGAGSGRLAADLLGALAALGALPERYEILELSAELRARQAETLRARVPHLAGHVSWRNDLPEAFSGCVLGNEVLDAMPFHLVVWRDGGIFERGVALVEAGGFRWEDRPASGRLLEAARALPIKPPVEGDYLGEIGLASRAWVSEWGRRLVRGALILLDYGYPRPELYLPTRREGTAQSFHRHRADAELLALPGLKDITAFVDFSAMAEAADEAGLCVEGYTSQAHFLANCGLLERLSACGESDSLAYLQASRAMQRLISPGEMGESFKAIAFGREIEEPLLGFMRGDRTHRL